MALQIEDLRKEIEKRYVGFSPSTHSVKPVHIANGLFRTLLGHTTDTKQLFSFVFYQTQKGEVLRGHDLESVEKRLREEDRLDNEISHEDLARLRVFMKAVLGADKAVFPKGMESYSAGNEHFVTEDRIAQDGGEFVAQWLSTSCPDLAAVLVGHLKSRGDPLSLLASPLLGDETKLHVSQFDNGDLLRFLARQSEAKDLWKGMQEAASCLLKHCRLHPNKLYALRLTVMFSCFVLLRQLSALETAWTSDGQRVPPFLLCFEKAPTNPVAVASGKCYTLVSQSLGRFYSWAFGECLKKKFTLAELAKERPAYKKKPVPPLDWRRVVGNKEKDKRSRFIVCGEALYDLLATEAEGSPTAYFRNLGVRAGFLWPPTNMHPTKRFRVEQDALELLVRGAVEPREVIDLDTLQHRLWQRYRVVVGGASDDQERLLEAGVFDADGDALAANQSEFVEALKRLDFAEALADGIVRIRVGV